MSFEEQYTQYFQLMYCYIFYMTGSKELAEDLTQETFLRIYNRRAHSTDIAYIRTVARHLVYDHYRKKALIQWLPFTKQHEQHTTVLPEQLIAKENMRELMEAMQQLKLSHKEVLIYRKIEGYSIEETARLLGWRTTKVVNTQRSAMKALQRILGGVNDDVE